MGGDGMRKKRMFMCGDKKSRWFRCASRVRPHPRQDEARPHSGHGKPGTSASGDGHKTIASRNASADARSGMGSGVSTRPRRVGWPVGMGGQHSWMLVQLDLLICSPPVLLAQMPASIPSLHEVCLF